MSTSADVGVCEIMLRTKPCCNNMWSIFFLLIVLAVLVVDTILDIGVEYAVIDDEDDMNCRILGVFGAVVVIVGVVVTLWGCFRGCGCGVDAWTTSRGIVAVVTLFRGASSSSPPSFLFSSSSSLSSLLLFVTMSRSDSC